MCSSLLAQTTNDLVDPDAIPPFRPAKGELPPTFWEQHGLLVVLGLVMLLSLVVVVWRIIANRPPLTPPTPAETARAALASVSGASASINVVAHSIDISDRVSAILRNYFVTALGLSIHQPTNRELAGELRVHSRLTPDLHQSAPAFLLALDQFRFNPDLNAPVPTPVQTAMALVDQTEAALRPPKPASNSASSP